MNDMNDYLGIPPAIQHDFSDSGRGAGTSSRPGFKSSRTSITFGTEHAIISSNLVVHTVRPTTGMWEESNAKVRPHAYLVDEQILRNPVGEFVSQSMQTKAVIDIHVHLLAFFRRTSGRILSVFERRTAVCNVLQKNFD